MRPLLALCVTLLLLTAGCGGGDNDPGQEQRAEGGQAPSTAVTGGESVVEIDESLLGLLSASGAELSTTGGATLRGNRLSFPITGGELDPAGPTGQVQHEGGLTIASPNGTVEFTNLVLDAGSGQITAEVEGERIPVFVLADSAPRVPIEGGVATLQAQLRTAQGLGDRLGIPLPETGLDVGRLVSSVRRG